MLKLGAKVVSADSEDADYPASQAIDGDAVTIWHTKWSPNEDPMPHNLVIDLGREVELRGIVYATPVRNTRRSSPQTRDRVSQKQFRENISKGALINNLNKLVLPHQAKCAMKGACRMPNSLHEFDESTGP
jgi:hypothetical protein